MKIISNFFCLLSCLFLFSSCSICKLSILETKKSPDSKYFVYVFERDCGATTGFNRQVSISTKIKPRLTTGNVFIMEGTEIEINWISETLLQIKYYGNEIIKKDSIEGVKIEYCKLKKMNEI